ncbi:AfsR/SARP family transcriptional regulator [Virgisporangium aurantiacum]|nr:BTAD domain-containing putative transcriptional regulator [Virgisporangium aurantiacum]
MSARPDADLRRAAEREPGEEFRFRVLGPWEVTHRHREAVVVPSGQQRTLLVSLLLSAGRPVTIDALADRLWPFHAPERVRGTVQTYAARLRRLLGRELIESTSGGGYRIAVPARNVDMHRFRELVDQSRTATAAADELSLLQAALGLWRGRPFTGVESAWLEREVVPGLTEEWLAATERRIDLELELGRPGKVIAELRGLINQDPTRESLWCRLIVALHRAGRRAEALGAYQQARATLSEELGIDPSVELQRLQRVVLQDAPAVPVPESRNPRQLPHDIAHFRGRAAELAALDALLPADDPTDDPADGAAGGTAGGTAAEGRPTTIVAIDGAPGMGKTTLAVHWAHRVSGRYPDAHLYLNLNGYGSGEPLTPAAAAATLLRGLSVAGDLIPESVDERAALLRTTLAGRRVLLLLDNARDADQVRALLPGADGLAIVTSRSQLRGLSIRDGAHRVTLHRLPVDESVSLLSVAVSAERLAAEPDAAARLVELCDGLPLALAIVAERAHRAGTLAEVVHALRDGKARLDNLGAGDGDPHTDLRAALSWSHRALDPDAAAMFDRLGLHPANDIGLESAAALANVPVWQAKRSLDRLAAAHMVAQRHPDRYELHDLIRLYAVDRAQRAGAGPANEAAVRRLLDWYLHAAVSADVALMPSRRRKFVAPYTPSAAPPVFADQNRAMAWFEQEYDGLRSVVDWAATHGSPGHAWRTAIAMTTFLDRRISWREGVEFLRSAGRAARLAGDRAGEGYTLNSLGCTYWDQRDWDRARDCFSQALACFRDLGDQLSEAMVLGNLGLVEASAGDPVRAQRLCHDALYLCEQAGYRRGVAQNLDNLGMAHLAADEPVNAIDCHRRAAELFQDLGDAELGAWNEQNLGRAYAAAGRHASSVRSLRLAVGTMRRLGHRRQEANMFVDLGNTLLAAGHPGLARDCWQTALVTMRQLADPRIADVEAAITEATITEAASTATGAPP